MNALRRFGISILALILISMLSGCYLFYWLEPSAETDKTVPHYRILNKEFPPQRYYSGGGEPTMIPFKEDGQVKVAIAIQPCLSLIFSTANLPEVGREYDMLTSDVFFARASFLGDLCLRLKKRESMLGLALPLSGSFRVYKLERDKDDPNKLHVGVEGRLKTCLYDGIYSDEYYGSAYQIVDLSQAGIVSTRYLVLPYAYRSRFDICK